MVKFYHRKNKFARKKMRKFYFLGEIFVKSSHGLEKSNDFSMGNVMAGIAWRESLGWLVIWY